MAVSADEVTRADIIPPGPNHPFLTSDGRVDRVWYAFLVSLANMSNDLKTLANATKTEVDTQHP